MLTITDCDVDDVADAADLINIFGDKYSPLLQRNKPKSDLPLVSARAEDPKSKLANRLRQCKCDRTEPENSALVCSKRVVEVSLFLDLHRQSLSDSDDEDRTFGHFHRLLKA
ncbi:hypothetical protein GCK72_018654 [Caenorhabditis remanei]|uniref:Uncharacterized protein n=1 Tax=Caenorhabditis remanei TaxID=31234 RepID=A0A6A5GAS0_CAERE|nr:hypothetical protein GCK72_018654 [Caenorhabditis remanei]KAF1752100.1 hypothetical protein GCK72_018654 [Caenorhabditis remanei]